MAIIQLPYYPLADSGNSQLNGIKRILCRADEKGYETGLQIFMGTSDRLPYYEGVESFESLADRIHKATGDEMWEGSSLHLPICPRTPDKRLHLGKQESLEFLSRLLEISRKIGLRRTTLHPNTTYLIGDSEEESFLWDSGKKKEARGFLKRTVELAERFQDIILAYENIPIPVRGDYTTDPKEVRIEPNLATEESIRRFLQETEQHGNVHLCFDIAHYLITRETLTYLKERPGLLEDENIRVLVGSLSSDLELIPTQEKALLFLKGLRFRPLQRIIEQYSQRITDVQIADTIGAWIPDGRLIKEGLVLEPGKNHYDEISEAVRELKDRPVALSIDVSEEDFVKRPNQEKTLEEVLRILR
jgi:sugar phosphate isomerase/epimerase